MFEEKKFEAQSPKKQKKSKQPFVNVLGDFLKSEKYILEIQQPIDENSRLGLTEYLYERCWIDRKKNEWNNAS